MKELFRKLILQQVFPEYWLKRFQAPIIREHLEVYDDAVRRVEAYKKGDIPTVQLQALKPELVGRPIIWQYWNSGFDSDKLPEVVRICMASVDHFCAEEDGYQIIRLSDSNLREYIDFPEYIWQRLEEKAFSTAYFSDLLRTALIATYGGIWFDATILLSSKLPEEWRKTGFFAFRRSLQAKYQKDWRFSFYAYWGWQPEFKVKVLSSIIVGSKDSKLIEALLSLQLDYWQRENKLPHYFMWHIFFEALVENGYSKEAGEVQDDTLPHIWQNILSGSNIGNWSFEQGLKLMPIQKLTYKTIPIPELHKALREVGLDKLIKA